ncbi:MAG: hypothetical protein ACYDCQ_06745 [Dehalococcoidia bacterium]
MAAVMERPETTEAGVTVRIQFSHAAYETLQRLAREKSKTVGEILGEALALEQFAAEIRGQGGRVLTERNGKFNEVVFA